MDCALDMSSETSNRQRMCEWVIAFVRNGVNLEENRCIQRGTPSFAIRNGVNLVEHRCIQSAAPLRRNLEIMVLNQDVWACRF